MNKILALILLFCTTGITLAFDYIPKDVNSNPFQENAKNRNIITEQKVQPELREITNLKEYFRYLPAEVHRHWVPYKSNVNYEVTVQFTVHRNGSISDVQIIGTNCPNANDSALNAVKTGAPYQPLPRSYVKDSVKAQVVLEYHKN